MCGIAGIVSRDPDKRHRITAMLDAMAHRGPDDEGVVMDESMALGQRRLSIIDLPGGHQPIPNHDNTAWIVFNGEIYNYEALRQALLEEGFEFRTHSDTEVILNLYERDGADCLLKLRGMFAFAIWDKRRQALFCARDRLGQKPFYYVHEGEEICFGSEIKALLTVDSSLRELNTRALDQYLSLRFICSPDSMFRRVRKLPPAHSLTFSQADGLKIQRYWDLDYEPKWTYREDELIDALEEKLIETLKLHMVSDVPVGAFMSGGLDSTLLVAMLMEHVAGEPIQTFSFGLPYGEYDESSWARLVALKYGTAHNERVITPSLLDNLDRIIGQLDEPSDPLSVCMLLLAEFASEKIKVAIGGDGGDELFGGYDRYYGNLYADLYGHVPRLVRKKLLEPILELIPDGRWYKSRAHQLKWLHEISFLEGKDRYASALGYFYFREKMRTELYGPALQTGRRPHRPIEELYEKAHASEALDKMLYTDSFSRLPDHPVMISDRMTMAHSLECRSPFMDHDLVEFAARMPARMKVRGRQLRYVQRRLAERYLPEPLVSRPKQGFSSALPYMLRDEYEILYDAFLSSSELAADGLIRQEAVDRLLTEHRAARRDHGNRLWLLVSSEAWYRVHIQGLAGSTLREVIGSREFNKVA